MGRDMTGHGQLAWQSGDRAIYAAVVVELHDSDNADWQVEVPLGIDRLWLRGVHLGVAAFRFFIGSCEPMYQVRNPSILVTELDGQPVDTSPAAVAFATFQALCEATGTKSLIGQKFSFDPSNGGLSIRLA